MALRLVDVSSYCTCTKFKYMLCARHNSKVQVPTRIKSRKMRKGVPDKYQQKQAVVGFKSQEGLPRWLNAKNLPATQETLVWSEEPSGLQSTESHRFGHYLASKQQQQQKSWKTGVRTEWNVGSLCLQFLLLFLLWAAHPGIRSDSQNFW